MGYTHYFSKISKTSENEEKFYEAIQVIKEIEQKLPQRFKTAGIAYTKKAKIRNTDGFGYPIFSVNYIAFNGDAMTNSDYESLVLTFEKDRFNFCKTARKPYDLFVCLCLITVANYIDDFEFSSDGNYKDWKFAFKWYKRNIGKINSHIYKFID